MSEYIPEDGGKLYSNRDRDSDSNQGTGDRGPNGLGELDKKKSEVEQKDSFISFLKELPVLIITAVVIAFVIKWLVVQPFYIPSQSMEPTLIPDDRVLVSKFIYRFVEPKPGDVIVFIAPLDDNRDYIKRIVATEGDKVEVKAGQVLINDQPLEQDYQTVSDNYSNWGPQVIKDNNVFVMGDNRPNSSDSRVFGQLPENAILGRAFMVYWPIDRIKLLN